MAGTNVQAIFNILKGPWSVALNRMQFVPTFNSDGTFSATLTTSAGATTDGGRWLLTSPKVLQPFANPQGHLTLTDVRGVVLFSNDILLVTVDMFTSETTGTGDPGAPLGATWVKFTP